MKTFPSYKYDDQSKLNHLSRIAVQYIDQIYDYFGVESSYNNNIVIKSTCFIHGGDNDTALNVYPNGDFCVHYKCRTHQCEDHFGTSFISLIRGALSRFKYKWKKIGDREASFNEAVEFLLNFTKQNFDSLEKNNISGVEKLKFCGMINKFEKPDVSVSKHITRDFYRTNVEIPSQYYLKRGYSIEVLDKYDVGTCKKVGKFLYNRAVVPIYNEDHEYILGFTGRSIFPMCGECKNYHNPDKECSVFPKWKHTAGFNKQNCLYNYWYAKQYILDSNAIILVESPGNVWRLEEAGIHNAVAIFGTALNDNQKKLIDESGAMSIVCLLDNDEAGRKGMEKIQEQCSKMYRLYFPNIDENDIGDMKIDKVTSDIKPLITQVEGIYNG